MESQKHREFQDLKEGIYFFPGGYLIISGTSETFLRHDNQQNNLQHLIKSHRLAGRLPDKYLSNIRLPEGPPDPRGDLSKQVRDALRDKL